MMNIAMYFIVSGFRSGYRVYRMGRNVFISAYVVLPAIPSQRTLVGHVQNGVSLECQLGQIMISRVRAIAFHASDIVHVQNLTVSFKLASLIIIHFEITLPEHD